MQEFLIPNFMSQKYDKLQIFTAFNYFPEDGYCYSSPLLNYPRNGLKNNFGLYTIKDINNLRFVVRAETRAKS